MLQLIAQHFWNDKLNLNGASWDRLKEPGNSIFEKHVIAALARGPNSASRLDAYRSLAALAAGNVKSLFKTAATISEESGVPEPIVRRTMSIAAMPHARIASVQSDSSTQDEQYRLTHDLFAPAVQSLARKAEASKARVRRSLLSASLVFSAVVAALVFGLLYRRSETQKRAADSLRLVAQAQLLQDSEPDRALLLGVEGYLATNNFESRNGLLLGLQRSGSLVSYLHRRAEFGSVAFSPDGKLLATSCTTTYGPLPRTSDDNTVWLWDVATRQPKGKPLRGHILDVWSVAFSPDGKLLASASKDGTLRLWDVMTRQQIGEPLEQIFSVEGVAFSPDGKLLASADGSDGTVRLWDVATRQAFGKPLPHDHAVARGVQPGWQAGSVGRQRRDGVALGYSGTPTCRATQRPHQTRTQRRLQPGWQAASLRQL
jgi:hypothetical protein